MNPRVEMSISAAATVARHPQSARDSALRLDQFCTGLYGSLGFGQVEGMLRKGAEEARNQLPELLSAAEQGRPTIITRHGRPVAVLAPIDTLGAGPRQEPLTPMAGSGRGLWGEDSAAALARLRDEWSL